MVEKHTDSSVLEACACLACALCSDAYTFSLRADRAFSQLLDLLAECFNSYCDEVLQVRLTTDSSILCVYYMDLTDADMLS